MNMNHHKVSIVVPVYKVEEYLDRCVTSIVNQTYENLEIILVDDGSPDNCPQMCDDWAKKDGRIKVIHKFNGGLSDARNFGIKAVTGEYVWFVDSDDYLKTDAIEILLNNAVLYNCDVVIFSMYRDVQGKVSGIHLNFDSLYSNNQEVKDKILNRYYTNDHIGVYSVWNKIYKTSFIKENNLSFDPKDVRCEDCWFNYKVFHIAKIVSFVSDYFYYYYDNKESITHNFNNTSYEMWVRNRQRLLDDEYAKDISIDFNEFYCEFIINVIVFLKKLIKYDKVEIFENIVNDDFFKNALVFSKLLPTHIKFIAMLIKNNKIGLVKKVYKIWNRY